MKRVLIRGAAALLLLATLPVVAFAQASLAGLVQDTSGGVLPGVTVEAASPALIEKARTTTTDANGRYSIPDLRPGAYTITFTLSGFSTFRREGVELTGTAVVTINADMRVGTLEETITVTGETPVVDVQSTTRQAVIDQEVLAAIPNARNPFTTGVLIPGVRRGGTNVPDVGGSVVQEVASLEFNGSRQSDQRMMVNGVALSTMIGGGWGGGAVPNATGMAEFAIDVSGVDAQAATGGVRINFIPRDGGNRLSGTVFGGFTTEKFASDNFTGSDVQARGLAAPPQIKGNGDFNPGVGGPVARDKVWFFVSGRYLYADNYVPGMFFNANANNLNNYRYVSTGEQAIIHQDQKMYQARVTWQANSKNKIGFTYDHEALCSCPNQISATVTPEASVDRRFPLQRFIQMDWNSPVSNRLLLEASAIHRVERWGGMHLQTGKGDNIDAIAPGMVPVIDNPSLATGASLNYRAFAGVNAFNNSWNWNIHYRAAVSYITGSHNFKVGFNNAYGHHENTNYTDPTTPYFYNFANGVPTQLTYRIMPRTVQVNVDRDLGLFAQDKWTVGRWTLAGGVRYDHFKNSFPPQAIAPTTLAPNLNVSFDRIENYSLHDITPKMGVTYDLFGNGKTALKVTLNKYLEGLGTTGALSDQPNPINRLNTNTTRNWTDSDSDFVPDCDLLNYATNGECGALVNAAIFGTVVPGTTYDPDVLAGWGVRFYNWEFTAGVQHELVPRLSLDVQFARRWYGNFRTMDDRAVGPEDYDQFTINVPSDSRLPNGGGYTLTAFDLKPAAFARSQNNFVTLSKNYGDQTEVFNAVSLGVNARLQNGLTLQAGAGTGRVITDDCDVVAALPETLHAAAFTGNPANPVNNTRAFTNTARTLERCKQDQGWRTSMQGLVAYLIPKIDVNISGTFQNLPGSSASNSPGASMSANAPIAATTTTLGRAYSSGPSARFFNIVEAGTVYVERMNQLDLRMSKLFRLNGTRTSLNFDFYNVLNSNSVINENITYGAAWRTPQLILLPRIFKLSAQFDF
jgi:Carboxypeptidase regulatory-like domain